MKSLLLGLSFPLILLIFDSEIIAADELFSAQEIASVADIHYWQFTIPDGLRADEKMGFTWLITDRIENETAIMKTLQSNVVFDAIPVGTENVKIFLWMDVFPTAKDNTPKSLRYCLKYKDPKTKKDRRTNGQLELPNDDGYYRLHACQGNGIGIYDDWILMLTGCKKSNSCFLTFGFLHDSEQ